MKVSKDRFFSAALKTGISQNQAEAFWKDLESESQNDTPFSNLLYYFGAMIVISAMTWFMSEAWMAFGGGGIFVISSLYALAFLAAGSRLWKRQALKTPAGLLITMAVCMVPLAIYGLETLLGIFPQPPFDSYPSFYLYVKSSWLWMELGTISAGILALFYFPFPFITAPIFFAAWFMSMDIVPLFLGSEGSVDQKAWISLLFGMIILFISYIIDLKKYPQYGFWGYLFGTITFWCSLTILCFQRGEVALLIYLLVNLSMMIKSVLLKRKVFLVFGAIGTFSYFSHLAYNVFQDSILFPFVLTILGLGVIYLGILYQRNSQNIESKIRELIPLSLRNLFPE